MKKLFRGLRFRLLLLGGIPILLQLCMTVLCVSQSQSVESATDGIANRSFPLIEYTNALNLSVIKTIRFANLVLLIWDNADERNRTIEKMQAELAGISGEILDLEKIHKLPETEAAFQEWKPALVSFRKMNQDFIQQISEPALTKIRATKIADEYLHGPSSDIKKTLDTRAKKLDGLIQASAHRRIGVSKQAARNNFLIVTIGGLAVFLISVLLIVVTIRAVTMTMDATHTLLNNSGQQINQAAEELSEASQSLSAGSAESAASLEESVASMAELSSMVKLNSESAEQAALLSKKCSQEAVNGSEIMAQLMSDMNQIDESSSKVRDIVTVIDDIAFQTNLLALNAAVEAARAGEMGKGFAVVADAVRSLAQKSAASAKEVDSLIKQSSLQVRKGVGTAQKTYLILRQLTGSIRRISDLNQEIAGASTEQSKGLEQIATAFNQLDQGVQNNAATSEQVASSAGRLSTQSEAMQRTIDALSIFVNGATSAN